MEPEARRGCRDRALPLFAGFDHHERLAVKHGISTQRLTATRRDDLRHGTNAGYVAGCVCQECREHQRQRMTTNC